MKSQKRKKTLLFVSALSVIAGVTFPGGPLIVFEPTGVPITWPIGPPVVWNPDRGGLGVLDNAEAVAFTEALSSKSGKTSPRLASRIRRGRRSPTTWTRSSSS